MDPKDLNVTRGKLIHQGKANNVYETDHDEYLELEASDRISAGNGAKTDVISGKGVANNTISKAIFTRLDELGIKNHYVCPGSNDCSKIVLKTEPILLEVIGRYFATGSYLKRYPETQNMMPFLPMLVEFTEKDDARNDPPILAEDVVKQGILNGYELEEVQKATRQIGQALKDFFAQCNGKLVDFKVEFGRLPDGTIILIDEISPDTCRILDATTGSVLDKDRFRKDMGNVSEAYTEMMNRVNDMNQ